MEYLLLGGFHPHALDQLLVLGLVSFRVKAVLQLVHDIEDFYFHLAFEMQRVVMLAGGRHFRGGLAVLICKLSVEV